MFGIFATIKIKPDQRDAFLDTIKETAFRSVSGEPGCMLPLRMLGTQWKSHATGLRVDLK